MTFNIRILYCQLYFHSWGSIIVLRLYWCNLNRYKPWWLTLFPSCLMANQAIWSQKVSLTCTKLNLRGKSWCLHSKAHDLTQDDSGRNNTVTSDPSDERQHDSEKDVTVGAQNHITTDRDKRKAGSGLSFGMWVATLSGRFFNDECGVPLHVLTVCTSNLRDTIY